MRRTRAELALLAAQDRVEDLAARHGRKTGKILAIAVPATLSLLGIVVWNQRPPDPSDHTVVQLSGACCTRGGAPGITVSSGYDESPGAQLRLFPLSGVTRVDDGRISLTYDLFTWIADPEDTGVETRLTDTDLRVGDTVTHGPATLEVVAIHDAFLDRNDAVDLRVTFDLDRVDEVP